MQVGVIGAGAAGLALLRVLSKKSSFKLVAFERASVPGGLWVHDNTLRERNKDIKSGYATVYQNLK